MFQPMFSQLGQHILSGDKLTVVDAGGAGGLIPHWSNFQGNASFYLFEPHSESFQKLPQIYKDSPYRKDFNFIEVALSGTGGMRKLYMTNSPTSSSILRPNIDDPRYANHPTFVPMQEKLIRTQTLKESMDAHQVEFIDAIKLDVQGAELEILKGLDPARLRNLMLVETEASLIDLYQGYPGLGEMMNFLSSQGLELYDMRCQREPRSLPGTQESYHEKVFGVPRQSPAISSKIYEVDLLFMRRPETFDQSNLVKNLRKLVLCQCVFNFFSEAYYLVSESPYAAALPEEERAKLREVITLWQRGNSQLLQGYQQVLQATNYQTWGQFAWVPYPCT